jgi:hypothetical protein
MKADRVLLVVGFLACANAWAGPFNLPTLSQTDVDNTSKTLASDLSFRPLEPASSFSDLIGVSFGVEANTTSTSNMSSILPGGPKYIPSGSLFLALQLPAGFAIEAGVVPRISYEGDHFSEYGGDLKWNFSKYTSSPVDLAVRAMYSHATLDFGEGLDGGNVNVDYGVKTYGAALGVSKNLLFIEPYADVGVLRQSGTLSGSGSADLFGTSYPVGTESATSNSTSPFYDVGVQVHLLMLQLTGEYSERFGSNAFAGKVSFRF